jgi:Bacterial SH3 domain
MRWSRWGAFVCLWVLWSTVALAQTTAVVTRNVNLRATPSTAQTPIRLLMPDETFTLITTTTVNGYYHVRTAQNEEGWVYRTFVKIGGAAPAPTPAPPGSGALSDEPPCGSDQVSGACRCAGSPEGRWQIKREIRSSITRPFDSQNEKGAGEGALF